MTPHATLTPITTAARIDSLDVLRGLALLGIALMNVEYFSAPMMDAGQGIDPRLHGVDWLADALVYTLVTGKFWTLFSLLFGMGFAVMLDRARAAGRGFVPLYLRRTLGLLLVGLAHAWLIWAGDILVSYALAAVPLLLWFRDMPAERLWKWGAGIWVVLLGLSGLGALVMMLAGELATGPDAVADGAAQTALRAAAVNAYASGSFAAVTAVRLRYFFTQALPASVALVPMVLGMFLIGAALMRSAALADPAAHRQLWLRCAWVGGLAGLALTALSLAIDPHLVATPPTPAALLAMVLHMAAAPLMALAYVAIVVLALQRGVAWLRVLAPAGRLALSNYLAQSLIGTLLFYGYGLGLWGEVSRAWQVLGVAVVFAAQLMLSRWWLAHFRFGPLEWLWRAFTYWQRPPLRRNAGPPTATSR